MKRNIFFKFLITMFILLPLYKGEIVGATNYIDVLIIEDRENSYSVTNGIKNILGFYGGKGTYINSLEYTSKEVDSYDKAIIISENLNIENLDLISDLKNFNGEIFWIGSGVEQILSKDMYKDEEKHGIVWHINNVWNMVIIPNESESFFILSEAFNYFFEKENNKEFEMILKISDIDIQSDTDKLRKIADYLYEENIPFVIVVNEIENITGVEEDNKQINYYKIKELFKVINYMEDKGGSVIVRNNPNIYEKVNDIVRKDYWKNKDEKYGNLQNFIENCIKNGIYPLGLELSTNEEKTQQFQVLKEMFTTFTYSFDSNLNFKYPFIVKDYKGTYNIITENIGVIDGNNKRWIEDIEYNIKKLYQVKGSTGGISFSSSLDIEYLREFIKTTKKIGVDYINLRNINNKVIFNNRLEIESLKGNISYKIKSNTEKEYSIEDKDYVGESFFHSTFSDILIISIGIFSVLFVLIYIYLNNHNNKNIN
ncbi:MAG: DUF2334 domain-containing protein [Clostridium perfringens]|nr:DUF2334 domain-containing protein [Clostridium perfringens]